MDKPNSLQYVLSSNIYRVYPHQPTRKQNRLGHMALHWDAYSAGCVGFCGSTIQLSYFYLIKKSLDAIKNRYEIIGMTHDKHYNVKKTHKIR